MGLPALSYASLEASANVALFVPLGFLAARVMSRRYWWLALLLCIILSGAGELAQDRFLPERVGNVEDVLLNAAGALAGVMMGSLPRRGRRRRARRHRGRHRPVALK
nr:VanZ family protein [Arthrobacter zhangbolii]